MENVDDKKGIKRKENNRKENIKRKEKEITKKKIEKEKLRRKKKRNAENKKLRQMGRPISGSLQPTLPQRVAAGPQASMQ